MNEWEEYKDECPAYITDYRNIPYCRAMKIGVCTAQYTRCSKENCFPYYWLTKLFTPLDEIAVCMNCNNKLKYCTCEKENEDGESNNLQK